METTRTAYEVLAVAPDVVRQLLRWDDAGRAPRMVLDEGGGSPLRCCLDRSAPGERIALVSYAPLRRWAARTGASPGPYDEVGPVFLHAEGCAGRPAGAVGFPEGLRGEHRALRAYDAAGGILRGRYLRDGQGPPVENALEEMYRDAAVAVVHVRAVEHGCFLAETRRR